MERQVLVADDEPLARERIRFLLERHAGYRIVEESVDGDAALEAIARHRPDIAFLDISMPGRTGVDVAEALLDDPAAPAVVFVTAHDEFAVRAFEVAAVDFLVKPVDRERFDNMLTRVERRLTGSHAALSPDVLRSLLGALRTTHAFPERFVVRGARAHYFVRVEDIESATASGNYVQLAAEGRTHLVRETMRSFEEKLDPARFLRIHRSTILCVDRIARVEPLGHGLYRLIMKSGARFESSISYGARIQALLR